MIATYATTADLSRCVTSIYLTHVCAQWRRAVTSCPTLWTYIIVGLKGMSDSLFNLFSERAEGCPLELDVRLQLNLDRPERPWQKSFPIPTIPPGQQIKVLNVEKNTWDQISRLICRWTDALSSLQNLSLHLDKPPLSSSTTIFVGEALKNLTMIGCATPGLDYVRAPKLTVLYLWDDSPVACSVRRLLDFFDASPALEHISIGTNGRVVDDFPPPDRKVMLPHLRAIFLMMTDPSQIVSHLICPSKMQMHLIDELRDSPTVGIFPPDLDQLLGPHSASTIERVSMDISYDGPYRHKYCSLRFDTSSGTTLKVARNNIFSTSTSDNAWTFPFVFDQVVTTLLSLQLDQVVTFTTHISHLTNKYPHHIQPDYGNIKMGLTEVLKRYPKLRVVELMRCLPIHFPDFSQDTMPPIQALVVTHDYTISWEHFGERTIEAARARHSRGTPLKRIEIITRESQPRIEQLESLVQEVVYREP